MALDAASIQGNEVITEILLKNATCCQRRCCECLFKLLDNRMMTIVNRFLTYPQSDIYDQDLLVCGAYLNSARGRAGQSALHVANIFGSLFTVEQCLSHGICADITDAEGYTALSVECAKGYLLCAKKLLQHGANPTYAQHERFRNQIPQSSFALSHSS